MGSIVYYCQNEKIIVNRDLLFTFDENKNQENIKQNIDIICKFTTKLYYKTFFQKLKNYYEEIKNKNKEKQEEEERNLNKSNENIISQENCNNNNFNKNIHNNNNNESIKNKNKDKDKDKEENDIKKNDDLHSNNGNLTLYSSSNIRSVNNNELDTQINDYNNINSQFQNQNQIMETPNPANISISSAIKNKSNPPDAKKSDSSIKTSKNPNNRKSKPKKQISNQLTPIPEYITPPAIYDKSKIPGEIMINLNLTDFSLKDEIAKVENEIGEFIIEEKEILKYMEQYPYVPKSFFIKYPSGEKYSGYFSPEWEKEVFGVQINKDGSKYVGFYKNGMFEGRGRLILNKGDYYEGEFKQSKANGFGKYVNTKGEIYIGNWVDNKQEGEGELILKDGSRYNGHFKNGMKNGKGKIAWNDSSYYEGEFVNNYFEGYGVYMMRNRKTYIGQWKKGQMNGLGIFICPDGKCYKGYYENDKKNGFGIYSGKNNLRYEGKFKKGKQYGIGKIINEKGEKQLGLYLKGKRLKILKEKDFKEDITNIDKEISEINNIINNNDFFVKNLGLLTIVQEKYFSPE